MELVVKLYSDKPSKIGVQFVYEYQAVREYEALVQKYPGESFHAKIEFVKNKILLTLQSDLTGGKVVYKDLEFRSDQIKRLQAFYSPELPLQFVHVFSKANTLFIAKPFRRQEFFKITDLDFIALTSTGY
jgi:hypothetical protein